MKEIKAEYNRVVKPWREDAGYYINVKTIKSGWLVFTGYSRNDFHDDPEDKVLMCKDGKVYRNNKCIAKWDTTIIKEPA